MDKGELANNTDIRKVRWGVLSTAKIGREKVIPAIQSSQFGHLIAIASKNREQAEIVAEKQNISRIYNSYEELLADPGIDAVYIPLPNHLHVEYSIKALKAGKHVLCEKPIALTTAQAQKLLEASKQAPHLKIMEAFMYRFHPQWQYAKALVDNGKVGKLKMVQSFFSYYNVDPNNIRNQIEVGGGALMDIGCYCISFARFLLGDEPRRVLGLVERDPVMQTDMITSGILDFSAGQSTFTCSTQLTPYQRVNILGTEARIEIEIPVNAPPDKPAKIWIHSSKGTEEIAFDAVDQYTIQADLFSQSILNGTEVPTPLEDAVKNMKVIEAIFESSEQERWVKI
jgi:predicted dehydrogenase